MYSSAIIVKTLADFEKRNGWMPITHSVDEVMEFREYIDSLIDVTHNERNSFYDFKSGVRITENKKKQIQRWITNEQFLCFADSSYFETRYAYICNEAGEIFKFRNRKSQEVFDRILEPFDEEQVAIELFVLKARQLGISTKVVLKFIHRLLFIPHTQAVLASVKAANSELLMRMMDVCWERLPFWLTPMKTSPKMDKPQWSNGSIASMQSGSQAMGIAQGWTPTCIHISEVADIPYPKKALEEGLFFATHSTRKLFFVLEGTGSDANLWQKEKWKYYKENWGKGGRFMPLFISWPCATDLYPEADWLRKNPIPGNWLMLQETKRMKAKAELYINSTPALSRVMGKNWRMPREQAWFWETKYREAVQTHTLKTMLAQFPCLAGDARISTDCGMIPIGRADGVGQCESGKIQAWIPKGIKRIYELRTKNGRVLRATKDHLIQMAGGGEWKEMYLLRPTEKIALLAPMFARYEYTLRWKDTKLYHCERLIDPKLGKLLGYFMGDGCFHSGELSIACDSKDQDTVKDVVFLIESILGKPPTFKIKGGCTIVRSSCVEWVPLLKAIGAIKPVIHQEGRTDGWKRNICVPECIFKSPKHVVGEFLSALFECDAFAHKESARVSLTSSKDNFLREVQQLLLGFEISAKFMKQESVAGSSVKKGRKGHFYTKRKLDIPSAFVNRFYREIGFSGSRKQGGKRQIGNHKKSMDTELRDEVIEVTDSGVDEPVYDLMVPETGYFSADGIKVHNCTDEEAFQNKNDLVFSDEVIDRIEVSAFGQDKKERSYTAYAVTGKSVLIGQDDEPYEPDPDQIDYSKERIRITWESKQGGTIKWELIPLLPFDDADDTQCCNKLLVFDPPKEGCDYSIGIDTADGLGNPDEDRSVCTVVLNRQGNERDLQAAEFVSNEVNPPQMCSFAACVAAWYGQWSEGTAGTKDPRGCKFIIEQRMRFGDDCYHQLKLMGFTFHHKFVRYDDVTFKVNQSHKGGWFTNAWSRPILTNRFVDAINNGWFKPMSPMLIRQLKVWVRKLNASGQSKLDHDSGMHDDNIMGNAMAYFTRHSIDVLVDRQQAKYADPEQSALKIKYEWLENEVTV